MALYFIKELKPVPDGTVKHICNCAFCDGGIMRENITHYKLTSIKDPLREWYLNISHKSGLVELKEKC